MLEFFAPVDPATGHDHGGRKLAQEVASHDPRYLQIKSLFVSGEN